MIKRIIRRATLEARKLRSRDYVSSVERMSAVLQREYNDFVEIQDQESLRIAKELVSQEGIVDLEEEGLSSAENQRDLSLKFSWGHDHRFNSEFAVNGRMRDRHVNLMSQFMVGFNLNKDHFAGKSIVDVGCWTGGTTLMLKTLGAGPILALEEVQKYARTARILLQDVYGCVDVTSDGTNIYSLDVPQKFDIAYFPGVIYHLSDPVLGLRRLFNSLKDGGECFVETAGFDSEESLCRFDGNRVFHGKSNQSAKKLNRGGWNWFKPTPACLERWMVEAGFDDVSCFYSYATNRVFGIGRRLQFNEITRAGLSRPDVE